MSGPVREFPPAPPRLLQDASLRGRDVALALGIAALTAYGGYRAVTDPWHPAISLVAGISGYVAWSGAYAAALIGAVWVVFILGRGLTLSDLRCTKLGGVALAIALGVGLLCIVLSHAAFDLVETLLSSGSPYAFGITAETTIFEAGVLVLCVGLLAPFAEELFYRGVLFRWLRQYTSFWPAAAASSVFFGAVHFRWDAIATAAAAGILFAWLFERSRSLLMSTVTHQTWNTVSVAMVWLERTPGP